MPPIMIHIECNAKMVGEKDMEVQISLRLPASEFPAFEAAFRGAMVAWSEGTGGCTTETHAIPHSSKLKVN
jgi:hypothetical protein